MSDLIYDIERIIENIERGDTQLGYIEDINLAIASLGGSLQFEIDGEHSGELSLVVSYISLLIARKIESMEKPVEAPELLS